MSSPLRRLPLVDQTAAHLREGFQSGRWVGQLPGVLRLAQELMVSKDIVQGALKILTGEGWIEDCGVGRKRKIIPQRNVAPERRTLRIGIMPYLPLEEDNVTSTTILLGVRRAIEMSGHICVFSDRSLTQMKDDLTKIARYVKAVDADAWIVSAASRTVLEWFVSRPFPVFALGGRFQNLPVASTASRLAPAIESVVNALVDHGHRRIVMLIETLLCKPTPIPSLVSYLSFLEARGIPSSDYNLPHFEDNSEGLENCLDGLFRVTPPTALIVHQAHSCVAVLFFLARRGLRVPQDVSVVCLSADPVFDWCRPPLDHVLVAREKYITRIARWVDGVAKGRPDQKQAIFDAEYVPGGTVGPVRK